jgi:hypothetical protein
MQAHDTLVTLQTPHTPPSVPAPLSQAMANSPLDTEIYEHQRDSARDSAVINIDQYQPAKRGPHEGLVQNALRASMEWLPVDGRNNIVNDFNKAHETHGDDGLYEVLQNLYTGLRSRSKFAILSGLMSYINYSV